MKNTIKKTLGNDNSYIAFPWILHGLIPFQTHCKYNDVTTLLTAFGLEWLEFILENVWCSDKIYIFFQGEYKNIFCSSEKINIPFVQGRK